MEHTPKGTSVGVDDPYEHAERCDHCTDDGRCRFAIERPEANPEFARDRRAAEYACVASEDGVEWRDCPHFRSRANERTCRRCGLEERRMAHTGERPLLEEHHLSYADDADDPGDREGTDGKPAHEITVVLCRWCHAKVHGSWARIDDDASPSASALAAAEDRRSRELDELGFRRASEREREER
ncbi:DUF7097 family protein [Halalkalicoccus subterraneus]|uniref:DUF7097 family protein n=1 Tax=Halalkalicoccus subterraneus TaxID=2675002 RepID=UPI000EFC2555|nr:hypothetical protein [Halalkalicoccus subterraneus]